MAKYIYTVIFLRFYLLLFCLKQDFSIDLLPYLVRGFCSDILVAIFLWFACCFCFKKKRFRLIILLVFVLAYGFNIEHVSNNGGNLNLSFIGYGFEYEFILGSVFSVRNLPVLFLCLTVFFNFVYWSRFARDKLYFNWKVPAFFFSLFIVFLIVPVNVGHSYWYQMSFLEENLRQFIVPGLHVSINKGGTLDNKFFQDQEIVRGHPSKKVISSFFNKDLDGAPLLDDTISGSNILLVLIEGLSQNVLERGEMPFLSSLANKGISFKNLIALQNQTNRGVYSLLCGDYPNYLNSEAKMDFAWTSDIGRACLPEILHENRYYSVFMQSSSLGFMHKGAFAAAIGFDEAIGDNQFDSAFARGFWGVDDRTLYHHAMAKIEDMSKFSVPWFMTLLTVGTHHPFFVPGLASPSQAQTLAYADTALEEFIEELERRGYLSTTLVVITSDESSFPHGKTPLQRELSSNHAPMVILVPNNHNSPVQEGYFLQSDLLISLIDVLGLDFPGLMGRSLFRSYSVQRNFFFGSVYRSRIYSYHKDGLLYVCSPELECETNRTKGNIFNGKLEQSVEVDSEYIELLNEALGYNEFDASKIIEKTSE